MVKVSGDFNTRKFMDLFRQYFISRDELFTLLGYASEIAVAENSKVVADFINNIMIPTFEDYFKNRKETK